jgi:hypothetical protein
MLLIWNQSRSAEQSPPMISSPPQSLRQTLIEEHRSAMLKASESGHLRIEFNAWCPLLCRFTPLQCRIPCHGEISIGPSTPILSVEATRTLLHLQIPTTSERAPSERLATLRPSLFRPPRPLVLLFAVLLVIFVQALSMSAYAGVQLTGEANAIRIEANEVSVEELLMALSKAYGLRYHSYANLDRPVSGVFTGSLQQAVSRVLKLQGYNFLSEKSGKGTMVTVYSAGSAPESSGDLAPKIDPSPPPAEPPVPPAAEYAPSRQDHRREVARDRGTNMRGPHDSFRIVR